MENSKKMLKTAGFMAVATFFTKVLGLARDMLIAGFFGTGIEADAYMTATRLPTTLFDLVIGGVISSAFIPVFNGVLEKESKKKALDFANRFVGMVMLITLAISVLGIGFSDGLISFMAPEFDETTHNLARELSNVMFPMIIFTGLAFSFVGILQSFGEYNIPAIMSLVSNSAVIIYFVLFGRKFGVFGLSVTMLLAWGLQVVIQIPSLKKFGYKFRPRLNFKDKNIHLAMKLAVPMLISTWVQPLYTIINTRLASGIDKGVSSMEYANRLYLVITGVFSFVVTNLIFPKMSRANVAGNRDDAKELTVFSLKLLSLVILPVMAVFTVLSKPVIAILYQHGGFLPEDTIRTGGALACYSFGMIGMAFNEILSKSFFSMQNSKTPMINAILSMVANIAIAYTLSKPLGIAGLAIATACGSTVNAILNFIGIRKYYGNFMSKEDIVNILKMAISSITMGAVMYVISGLITGGELQSFAGNILTVTACGVAGLLVYAVLCLLFKVDIIVNLLRKGD